MATSMAMRRLGTGSAALTVSAQGFGCMGMTANYASTLSPTPTPLRALTRLRAQGEPMADDAAFELMKAVYGAGVTFWDTAEAYSCPLPDGSTKYNETVLGDAIRALGLPRDELQLATKIMPTLHRDTMTAESCIAACQASCDRLGVDSVDLYYVHRFHDKVDVQDQARAMLAVKDAGLAKCIGVSEFSPRSLREFHAICPVTCIQNECEALAARPSLKGRT